MSSIVQQLFGQQSALTGFQIGCQAGDENDPRGNPASVISLSSGERTVEVIFKCGEDRRPDVRLRKKNEGGTENDLQVIRDAWAGLFAYDLGVGVSRVFVEARKLACHLYFNGDTNATGLCVTDRDMCDHGGVLCDDSFALRLASETAKEKQLRHNPHKNTVILYSSTSYFGSPFGVEAYYEKESCSLFHDALMKTPLAVGIRRLFGGAGFVDYIYLRRHEDKYLIGLTSGDKTVSVVLSQHYINKEETQHIQVDKLDNETTDDDLHTVSSCLRDEMWMMFCSDLYLFLMVCSEIARRLPQKQVFGFTGSRFFNFSE